MPKRRIAHARAALKVDDALAARFAQIRAEFDIPTEFPAEVLAEAAAAAHQWQRPERDETAVPFVTIDPASSMDLDQALHIERDGEGYRVRYAIADVPAFVAPGGAIDAEARRRGQTIYSPDGRSPLHPPVLSEAAASLLPGVERPAYIWDLRVRGFEVSAELYRGVVRSRQRYAYDQVQALVDSGQAPELLVLLRELGELRIAAEQARGGASLPMPEQEVELSPEGDYQVRFRPPLASEEWNAQVSLMTGIAAATMMVQARIGILRTMPGPTPAAIARFRREARTLGVAWGSDVPYGEFLRALDRTDPRHLALIFEATRLFRGAGYTPLDGVLPEQREHAAVASVYAHVTAPLRRLVDRFGLVICEHLAQGKEPPDWARLALPELPGIMRASDSRASGVERASADAVEAAVLAHHVGESFSVTVVDRTGKGAPIVQLADPAVVALATGDAPLGATVPARLTQADISRSLVTFALDG